MVAVRELNGEFGGEPQLSHKSAMRAIQVSRWQVKFILLQTCICSDIIHVEPLPLHYQLLLDIFVWMSGARISFERADANCRTPTINGRSYELSTVSVCAPFLRTSHCCRSSMCPIMMRATVLFTVSVCSVSTASLLSAAPLY